MVTYQDFLSERDALSFDTCQAYYESFLVALDWSDEEQLAYWRDFVGASVAYAQARGEWLLFSREEKQAKDEARTIRHNKVLFTLKLFIAYSQEKGRIFPWYDAIKDKRKQVGDLACYVAYVYAVNAR